MPPKQNVKNTGKRRIAVTYVTVALAVLLAVGSLPAVFSLVLQHKQSEPAAAPSVTQFPISVDPRTKTITPTTEIDSYLEQPGSPLEANVSGVGGTVAHILQSIAIAIDNLPFYQSLASVSGIGGHFVTITPGLRKEQVADIFAKALSWNKAQEKEFLTPSADANLPLDEGSFFPNTYFVNDDMTPADVQTLINKQFTDNVLSHYGTSTASVVPLDEALTIASIVQRETIDNSDMRLISGIIWNRLFAGMNLQVDSTLQYAKANLAATTVWWPPVLPKDKYIKSPYNTYMNAGLPPTPIANPSVAAILAALNPIQTSCLYYFNDKDGNFHCSDTYAEHQALLKKYYP